MPDRMILSDTEKTLVGLLFMKFVCLKFLGLVFDAPGGEANRLAVEEHAA